MTGKKQLRQLLQLRRVMWMKTKACGKPENFVNILMRWHHYARSTNYMYNWYIIIEWCSADWQFRNATIFSNCSNSRPVFQHSVSYIVSLVFLMFSPSLWPQEQKLTDYSFSFHNIPYSVFRLFSLCQKCSVFFYSGLIPSFMSPPSMPKCHTTLVSIPISASKIQVRWVHPRGNKSYKPVYRCVFSRINRVCVNLQLYCIETVTINCVSSRNRQLQITIFETSERIHNDKWNNLMKPEIIQK